jgi:2-(1,2-epoxy-1,2-dihydrophenyl)acetyl-CoA isomerase
MQYLTLLLEKKVNTGIITLNRPQKLNAFNDQAFEEFIRALSALDKEPDIRVIVIAANGRAFSAGADLDEGNGKSCSRVAQIAPPQWGTSWIPCIMRNISKPIIASIDGAAVGAGFTIALACDIRIASVDARFSAAFANVGLFPELGSTYNLPRLVGIAKACELVFTGKMITAEEAKEIGLINIIVPKEKLDETVTSMAMQISQAAPIPVQLAKRALYQGLNSDLISQIQFEQLGQNICLETGDFLEGVAAFKQKRKPVFKGK